MSDQPDHQPPPADGSASGPGGFVGPPPPPPPPPGAYGPGPYGPGPEGPGAYGPGPDGPGAYGPGSYGAGPHVPGPHSPGPYGPGPYAAGPYGAAPYGPPQVDVMEAFRYGWTGFSRNVGPFLLAMLTYLVGMVVVVVVGYGAVIALVALTAQGGEGAQAAGGIGAMLMFGAMLLVASAAGFVMQAALARAALHVTKGRRIAFGTFFRLENLGQVFLASLLVAVAVSVGSMLFYLPGIVAGFYAQFVLLFVVGRGQSAMEAIRSSIAFTNANLGPALLLYIGYAVVTMLGSFACGVGILVAVPVAVLAQAYVFRRLHAEPVADPLPA